MCKYEMDPTGIVEDTEQTWFCPQTDGQIDGRTDNVKPVYPPFNFVEVGGIISQSKTLQSKTNYYRIYHHQMMHMHVCVADTTVTTRPLISCWYHDMQMSPTSLALCEGNPPVTDGFPSQWACNVESISMLWHHHVWNSQFESGKGQSRFIILAHKIAS